MSRRTTSPTMRRSLLFLALTLPLAGCSLARVKGPPDLQPGAPRPEEAACTERSSLPVLDTFAGAGAAGFGLLLLLWPSPDDSGSDSGSFAIDLDLDATVKAIGAAWTAAGAGLLFSGHKGRQRVNACREFLGGGTEAGPRPEASQGPALSHRSVRPAGAARAR